MIFYDYLTNFYSNWLYSESFENLSNIEFLNLFNNNLIITNISLVHILSIITIALTFICACWLVKWFVNFIFGLGGRYE